MVADNFRLSYAKIDRCFLSTGLADSTVPGGLPFQERGSDEGRVQFRRQSRQSEHRDKGMGGADLLPDHRQDQPLAARGPELLRRGVASLGI